MAVLSKMISADEGRVKTITIDNTLKNKTCEKRIPCRVAPNFRCEAMFFNAENWFGQIPIGNCLFLQLQHCSLVE